MTGNWTQLYIDGAIKMGVGFAAAGGCHISKKGNGSLDSIAIWGFVQFSMLNSRDPQDLQAIQHWKIKHIPRERNQVVDHITKMATEMSTYLQVFEDIPKELLPSFEINRITNLLLC
ncbi:hypothetical protein PVK06_007825 [Gossypium arboreum]|uniref:RNase H type-1 domain-containing protein n=1 Tax=Gossypium arboreum TaxID=29729 RepID=A0ABR0QID7_GOSAR|nr:hypothetical protein PVK06_007825 [Gossypium arboreum]